MNNLFQLLILLYRFFVKGLLRLILLKNQRRFQFFLLQSLHLLKNVENAYIKNDQQTF